ncbi:unnamed protein product [Chrysoparadoxa australica]
MRRPEDSRSILSSLPLQIMVYFDYFFSGAWLALSLCLYIYKSYQFYYPSSAIGLEVCIVLLYGLIEYMRLFLTSKGNKTESIDPLGMGIVLSLPIMLVYVYMMSLQTYVLRLELVMAVMGLVFVGMECLLSLVTALSFYQALRG